MSPAPESTPRRPVLGHVNLMADTLIANANLDECVPLPFLSLPVPLTFLSSC